MPGVVWAAEQRERVLHRLDGTTGVDTPIPLDGVVGPEYQITWLVLYGGAVYVSFIPNPESPTGADGVPLPDLVVRVDQATLVPEAPREMDGRVGATGGKMVLLGSDGIVAELDPAMLEPIDDATATTRPPVAWGVLQVDETLAWTADQHGDALQILQRNPDTSRVVASGQTLSGFGEQLFVSVWRFAIGRDLYVLLSDDQGGVASRMWRVAPAADAALVPDVQIADAATDGATSSTTTSTTTPPAPGADALTAERLADVPGSIQVAASPDGASLIAVTRDWTQTGSPSTLLRIDGAGAVTHNVPLETSTSVSQVVVTPSGTWLLGRSVDSTNGDSICQLQQLDTVSVALGTSVTFPPSRNCGAVAFDRQSPAAPLWLTQFGFGRELFTVDLASATAVPVIVSPSVPPGYTVSSVVAVGTSASLVLVNDRDEATNRPVTAPDGSALPPLVLKVDAAGAITGPELVDPDDPPSATPTVPGATLGEGVLWTVGPAVAGAFEIRHHDVDTGAVVDPLILRMPGIT